jgi:hypothetical protein
LFILTIGVNKLGDKLPLFAVTAGIVNIETFFSLTFWPVNSVTRSAVNTLFFYLFSYLAMHYIENRLVKSSIIKHAVLVGIAFFLMILTSPWYTGI